MSNRLQKLALTTYTPAVPSRPAVPAYCTTTGVEYPARTVVVQYTVVYKNGKAIYYPVYEQHPPQTVYTTTCYPSQPAVAGSPAVTQYTPINGWDAGARSKVALDLDGHFQFYISGAPSGVVIGLSTNDFTTLPNEPSHAFYVHGTQVDLLEYGEVVASAVAVHSSDKLYKLIRRNGVVTWDIDGWTQTSSTPAYGAQYLDAALYTSGDFVDSPALEVYENTGEAAGSLAPMVGAASDEDGYSLAEGRLGAMVGSAEGGQPAAASGALGALTGVMSEGSYSLSIGTLGALSGTGNGGFPQVTLATGQGAIAPLVGTAHGLTGEIGTVAATLRSLAGVAADYDYAGGEGTLPALQGLAYDRLTPEGTRRISSALVIGQRYVTSYPHLARISSGLTLGSSVRGQVRAKVRIGSLLLLGSKVRGLYDASADIESRLYMGSRVTGSSGRGGLSGQLQDQPLQYATNAQTSWVTRYTGMDFTQFARADGELFAVRTDGVYRLGVTPEEGIDCRIDFGATSFGTNLAKTVTDLYLTGYTDGAIIATADTDHGSTSYRVAHHSGAMRSRWGKGVFSREWGVTLDISGATYLNIDSAETVVYLSNRYWVRT